MVGALLIVMGMLAAGPGDEAAPGAVDRAEYEAARKAAGRDARAQVRLALWCEAHGMTAERMKHLAAAVMDDPANALARGLMGLVADRRGWARPGDIERGVREDAEQKALMDQYLERRARTRDTADDQWKLALWCERNGLKDQAVAHYHSAVRLDPRRDAAWRHLGYKKAGARWVKPETLEAERREAEEQGRANKHWRPILERWRSALSGRDKVRRGGAEAGLAEVTDPRAVPMIWAVFATRGADEQATAVRVLARVASPGASRALAMLAVYGRSAEVRRDAAGFLKRRDPREFMGTLVGLVRDPLKYEVRPGPARNAPGELFVEGQRYNVHRTYFIENDEFGSYDFLMTLPPRLFDPSIPFDPFGPQNLALASQAMWGTPPWANAPVIVSRNSPSHGQPTAPAARAGAGAASPDAAVTVNRMMMAGVGQAAQRDILIAQRMMYAESIVELSRQRLRDDVRAIEDYNAEARRVNDLAVPVLAELTGVDLGKSAEPWQAWWTDQQGYAHASPDSGSKPTYTEFVMNTFTLDPWRAVFHMCFAAGTPIHTIDGPRAIESIWAGDRVLAQDVRTGRLAFTPVVAVFHNKPSPTFRVKLKDQTIVATGIHRLWKAGQGWVMARELKPGDVLRTIGGVAAVESVEADRTQPVFNLQVADGESYFVGASGVLAHDNSTINPVLEPFDAVGPLMPATASPARPRSMLGR